MVFQSDVYPIRHLTFPLDKRSSPRLDGQPPGHVSPLSGWVLPYPAGYGFPRPFGCRRSLLGRPVPAVGLARSCDRVTGCLQTTTGLPRSAEGRYVGRVGLSKPRQHVMAGFAPACHRPTSMSVDHLSRVMARVCSRQACLADQHLLLSSLGARYA